MTRIQMAGFTDEQLAERVARRAARRAGNDAGAAHSQAAFHELYARHAPAIVAFLASRGVAMAQRDDAHQEIWLRVWRSAPDGFHGGNFRAWLFQITRNYLIDLGRKKSPEPLGDRELDDPRAKLGGDGLEAAERAEILKLCLEKLDVKARDLVQARLAGESYEEVCARLEMARERAHGVYHRAVEQLKQCVKGA